VAFVIAPVTELPPTSAAGRASAVSSLREIEVLVKAAHGEAKFFHETGDTHAVQAFLLEKIRGPPDGF
jgi:hypothetical protein